MKLTNDQKLNKLTNSRLKDRTLELIKPFASSIKHMRRGKKPVAWLIIANIIKQATGTRIKPETIKRHYETNLQEAA